MKRFALIAAFAALLAGVVAMPGSAASFDDTKPVPGPAARYSSARPVRWASRTLCSSARCAAATSTGGKSRTAGCPRVSRCPRAASITGTPTARTDTQPWMTVHDLHSVGGRALRGAAATTIPSANSCSTSTPGLSIQNQSVPGGTIGQPYSQTLTALSITSTHPAGLARCRDVVDPVRERFPPG